MSGQRALAVTYEADGQEINLNPSVIARYVLGGEGEAISEKEMAKVIMTCSARRLNPFSGDVSILPHKDKYTGQTMLSVCPSIDFYQKRAMSYPTYRGIQDGVVVRVDGKIVKKNGCAVYKELDEELIGGWAAVYVEDYEKPVYCEVSLEEYNQHRSLWKSKPATMINKVAKAQALRKAFPDAFMGTYEPSEMGLEAPAREDSDARAVPMPEQGTLGAQVLQAEEAPDDFVLNDPENFPDEPEWEEF